MATLSQISQNELASFILYDLKLTHFNRDIMKLSYYLKEYYPDEEISENLLDILNLIETMEFDEFNEREEMNFKNENELLNSPYYKSLLNEEKLNYINGVFIIDKFRNKYWF